MERLATIEDISAIVEMAKKLYKSDENLYSEFKELIDSENSAVFVSVNENNELVGFSQVQIRHDYVEGCKSNNVGYLEGVFIDERFRKMGYGKKLVDAVVLWAKEKNCTEFASDCEFCNINSAKFHKAVGFQEVNKIVCFKKDI